MNYRHSLLLAATDLGASGTKDIDIKINKPISQIRIYFQTTKVLYQMTAPGPGNVSKIELVDGSKPLHSLTGYENQALAYYSHPGIAMEHGQHIQSLSEVDLYQLSFGRWLWDEVLAFDPSHYQNPQLKLTWDEDVADTSVTVNSVEIWADIFDEKQISPIGFLSAREHKSYTLGTADSYENVLLPTDRVLRQVLVRAYQDGYEPWYSIDEARFDENSGDRIPWEYTDLERYYRMMKAHWPIIETPLIVEPTSSERVYYIPQTDYWATAVFTNVSSNQDIYLNAVSGRGGKLPLIATGNAQAVGIARGYLPWHCYQFPMGRQMDIEDWYNPSGKAPNLRLRASTGGTSSTGQVVVEELMRY